MLQGDTITFSANITGNGWPAIYTYQWQYFDPLGGWKNWGMGATQAMANAQARSDSMQVRVAVSNLVGTTYSNIVTLFVVTKPTNVAIALTNGVPPGSGIQLRSEMTPSSPQPTRRSRVTPPTTHGMKLETIQSPADPIYR